MTSDDFEIGIDFAIAAIAMSAAAYALYRSGSYFAGVCAVALSAIIFRSRYYKFSNNIGKNLENAHYLIIAFLVLGAIWFGALNAEAYHSSWPIIAGTACASIYIKDAMLIYKRRL